jgi:hypothetical protein
MKNNLLNQYKNPNQTYTGIDSKVLIDDYRSVAEREMLYRESYRYYFDENGNRLTYRDPFPEPQDYSTDRKQMRDVGIDGIENPGRSLEEFLGECDAC